MANIGDIVYLTEPVTWRCTPDGSWDEHVYPVGTACKIVGRTEGRGFDIEFVENGIYMGECGPFVKFSTVKPVTPVVSNDVPFITIYQGELDENGDHTYTTGKIYKFTDIESRNMCINEIQQILKKYKVAE